MLATFLYSISGLRTVWKKQAMPSTRRMIPYSSVVVLVIVGFIIGALVVGVLAGATQSRLLKNSGKQADIVIVQGAGNQGNAAGYFSPRNFTVRVGQTVVWSNGDASTHTVTSATRGIFDSGNIASGDTFSYTFTTAGSYQYYCTIHPWMKGTIVVTSG